MTGRIAMVLSVALLAGGCGAELAVTDGAGRVTVMTSGGESVEVHTDLVIPQVGWEHLPGQAGARELKSANTGGRKTWTGKIEVNQGQTCDFQETFEEQGTAVHLEFTVTPGADIEAEGVFLFIDVPRSTFAGGQVDLSAGNAPVGRAEMPREQPRNRHFLLGAADHVTLTDALGRTTLDVVLDRPLPVTLQDTREWQGTTYSAFVQLAPGPLRAGQVVTAKVDLKLTTQPDTTPVHLTLDAGKVRYRLDGFGGDYCFGIESPITRYTLDNLNIAWARTEMTPAEWEPENDNASPTDTNWAVLTSHDQPDSNLRREFLLAREIQKRGVPYVISIWYLPEWLYAPPGKASLKVAPGKWSELLECIGSYLEYAKKQYGVEPDLFCFNEPNIGVYTLLSPEEHREAIKSIGADFARRGLKTKMLLGDATGPRGTQTYVLPAAADPEAMRYVGAVAFHSWGGASPAEYAAWGDVAERLMLPLLVTELGVDAGAWRTAAYDSFHYAVEEVRMYQELLLYARPQGTMQWEFTNDYGIVKEEKDAAGQTKLVPTVRFWFVKHFCNLTPPGADALGTASDQEKVLFTAFSAGGQYTLHIANLGPEREATLAGLPARTASWRAIRTSETQRFQELEPVRAERGEARLHLAPLSLVTLTTAAPE